MFFAGVVSKLGAYGFIRFCLTLFPGEMNRYRYVLAALAILSIIYGALMALSERDLKRIVAYASISHLGFIALGIFSLTTNGLNGAVIQIVNHGIIISALFLIVGFIESRTGTRDLHELSGLERRMPWLYFLFLVATLASLGMPGSLAVQPRQPLGIGGEISGRNLTAVSRSRRSSQARHTTPMSSRRQSFSTMRKWATVCPTRYSG